MLLELVDTELILGERRLFDSLSLSIAEGDRLALVGANGAGKSTLLDVLAGERDVDAGHARRRRGLALARVLQFLPESMATLSVDELFEQQRDVPRWRLEAEAGALGLDEACVEVLAGDLSGGQCNRLLFALALARDPDLLLLDEPTNHMDLATLMAFESALARYRGAVVVVSHDRVFLDAVSRATVILRSGKAHRYDLPFSAARVQLAEDDAARDRQHDVEQRAIDRLQSSANQLTQWSRAHESEKLARRARSMQRRVDRLAAAQADAAPVDQRELSLRVGRSRSKQMLRVTDLRVGYPGVALFDIDDLLVRPGERIALLGANGAGKSTFVRRLVAAVRSDVPTSFTVSPQVRLGYYDQELDEVSGELGVAAFLSQRSRLDDRRVHAELVAAGFAFAMHEQAVGSLSGGERARLLLLALAQTAPNLLVLDEPTNHIDIEGREQLEEQLANDAVTLLLTSHDRRFIELVANRYLWINDGQLLEIGDPEEAWRALETTDSKVADSAVQRSYDAKAEHTSAEQLLERLVELETKLDADLSRKPKFQKPDRQAVWRAEIDSLSEKLK